jgi:hypothetical protein
MSESLETQEQRLRLRAEYQGLYDRLLAILFRHDPVGINFGTNTDEYDPEVQTILPRLSEAGSAEDLRRVVGEEFVRLFGIDYLSRDEPTFHRMVDEIWQAWRRHREQPVAEGLVPEDKRLAESLLKLLCVGRLVTGVGFGHGLDVLLREGREPSTIPIPPGGQILVHLGSPWALLASDDELSPAGEHGLPDLPIGEQLCALHGLWQDPIIDMRLGDRYPDLFVHVESGRFLFVNGRSSHSPCWHLGVSVGDTADPWLVAGPGGMLTFSLPQEARGEIEAE